MSAAVNASSNAMPHSSSGLLKTPTLAQRRPIRPRRERGADLAGDDAEERHRRGLEVGVVQRRPLPDRVAGAPAGRQQHEEEARHHERGGDHAEEEPGADQQRPPDHALAALPRRPLHDPRLRRVAAERERGQGLRAEVDREDLHRGQRQRHRAAREREDDEGHDLRRRVGEDVEDELADVVVDAPALLDGVDDRREVVVGEHHRGRLAGDVGAGEAHRDADVGGPQRRGVVDAVAGHRDHVPERAQRVGDPQLRLGRRPREDQVTLRLEQLVELRLAHGAELGPRHDPSAVRRDADPPSHLGGGQAVVAGDDDDADAGGVAAGDGLGHVRARRVEQRDEADEAQIALGVLALAGHRLVAGRRAARDAEDAEAALGRLLDLVEQLRAHRRGQRSRLTAAVERRGATIEQHVGRTLRVRPTRCRPGRRRSTSASGRDRSGTSPGGASARPPGRGRRRAAGRRRASPARSGRRPPRPRHRRPAARCCRR